MVTNRNCNNSIYLTPVSWRISFTLTAIWSSLVWVAMFSWNASQLILSLLILIISHTVWAVSWFISKVSILEVMWSISPFIPLQENMRVRITPEGFMVLTAQGLPQTCNNAHHLHKQSFLYTTLLSIFNVKFRKLQKFYTKYRKFTQALLARLSIIPCLEWCA